MNEMPQTIDENSLREQQSGKVVDLLRRIGAYEYTQHLLASPEAANQFSFEKFKDFLVRINGIARDIPIHERRTDGERVRLEGMSTSAVPRHEDKEILLREAYESLGGLSLEDRAYLLPAMINEVHLFNDGNGRTSRILYTLLRSFVSEQAFDEALKTAIGKDGRYNSPDPDPSIIGPDREKIVLMRHGIKFGNEKGFFPVAPEDLRGFFAVTEKPDTPNGKKLMDMRDDDHAYVFLAAYEFLKEEKALEDFTVSNEHGDFLSPLKMEQTLTEGEWGEIFSRYFSIKREHARLLISAFLEPENYKNMEGTMNLKDYFKGKVQKRWEENRA
ncbi:hypothetical protein A2917_00485 [Candidatus Nomurabacteria bacterium RIFCSPLOWO2_01_FULL_42_17]|uniref:Fido domain-containing protein n=1 Tax=Candidatus Nomurabacteria bacterium RIFCSPLOWO2_01_FULL_42_17 TaxID=1801780 RepID=A0A1F6XNS4_9BACT|nr:MAG: hypothetical protein A2917_00485 [Candidatus Nomurabacteria bacterium RIFCSPLOWO2_01_FULL_42_17]